MHLEESYGDRWQHDRGAHGIVDQILAVNADQFVSVGQGTFGVQIQNERAKANKHSEIVHCQPAQQMRGRMLPKSPKPPKPPKQIKAPPPVVTTPLAKIPDEIPKNPHDEDNVQKPRHYFLQRPRPLVTLCCATSLIALYFFNALFKPRLLVFCLVVLIDSMLIFLTTLSE